MKTQAFDHPQVLAFSLLTGESRIYAYGVLTYVVRFMDDYCSSGIIDDHRQAWLMAKLGFTNKEFKELIIALVVLQFLEERDGGLALTDVWVMA